MAKVAGSGSAWSGSHQATSGIGWGGGSPRGWKQTRELTGKKAQRLDPAGGSTNGPNVAIGHLVLQGPENREPLIRVIGSDNQPKQRFSCLNLVINWTSAAFDCEPA